MVEQRGEGVTAASVVWGSRSNCGIYWGFGVGVGTVSTRPGEDLRSKDLEGQFDEKRREIQVLKRRK